MRRPRPLLVAALGLAATLSTPAVADDADQARRLAELRAEVESLAAEVEAVKEDSRGELRSLELQKTDLEARIRQEEVRVQELRRMIDKQRQALQSEAIAGEVLTPVLQQAFADLRASIRAGLPYRIPERLQAVDDLEKKLVEGTLTPQRASMRTWQLVEDELRLTRENILDRQVIAVDGSEVLADVARLGMMMMYFRTEDGRVGAVTGAPGSWTFSTFTASADVTATEELFDALDKQVRVGWFELPNALPEGS